jgi:hypothetical protein
MARAPELAHDQGMTDVSPRGTRRYAGPGTTRERSLGRHNGLSRAAESLMRSAAAVRRSAGHPQEMTELAGSLEHVEEALDDLSAGMARIAMAMGEDDQLPGGVAWRLHALHHALRAARDLCAGAKGAAPDAEPHRRGRPSDLAEHPSGA